MRLRVFALGAATLLALTLLLTLQPAPVAIAQDAASDDGACKYTYDNFGKAFIDKYCIECHHSSKKGEVAREGAPPKLNYDQMIVLKMNAKDMVKMTSIKKKMPEEDPKPTDEERMQFQQWMECEYK
ncbi:hypothetical protein K8I61_13835 [bacterium]|nr:hypothetical protein [bacterium]